jgi:hypothetical protein
MNTIESFAAADRGCIRHQGIAIPEEGWPMSVKPEYLSPCGMYCSVCSVRAADRDRDLQLKEHLALFFGTSPENIACEGCRSGKTFEMMVKTCSIRTCAQDKGWTGCHECPDFPCDHIRNFPLETARLRILEAIPLWRQLGTERYVAEVEKRFTCTQCGTLLHRYAQVCSHCHRPFSMT